MNERGPRQAGPFAAHCDRSLLDEADHVALGVREQGDRDPDARNLVGAHHPRAAEALGLLQRLLDVVDLDVERDVALIALGRGADAAADPDAVGVRVAVARDDRVVRRPDRVAELPPEQLRVVAAQLVAVSRR